MKRLLMLAVLMVPSVAFAMEKEKEEARKPAVEELRDKLGEGNGGTVAEEDGLTVFFVEEEDKEEPSLREVLEQMKELNIANTKVQTRVAAAFERLADAQERTAQVLADRFAYKLLAQRNGEDVVMRSVTGPAVTRTKRSHEKMYKELQERYFRDRTDGKPIF